MQVKLPDSFLKSTESLWTSLTDPNKPTKDPLLSSRGRQGGGMMSSRRAHSTWGAKKVGDWLASIGLGEYANTFEQHCMTGDLLELLTEEHLRDSFGISIVGHRLILLRELAALKRRSAGSQRLRTLWSGTEVRHRSGRVVTCATASRADRAAISRPSTSSRRRTWPSR